MRDFVVEDLKKLWRPEEESYGEDNGQVTIIGGSRLFHGAPIVAVRAASRLVDMVFFSSPEASVGRVAEKIKAGLGSFIWVPWEEVEEYVAKSDAVLMGPGFMRFESEKVKGEKRYEGFDSEGKQSREITRELLKRFFDKRWVIDGGSLQVMERVWIPAGAILTPNRKEFELLFGSKFSVENLQAAARDLKCVIVYKAPVSYVADGETVYAIRGGNAGLTKGATGDCLAGVVVGLAAKNPPLLAGAAGTYLIKKTAEMLFERVGLGFNADDLAGAVFETKKRLVGF